MKLDSFIIQIAILFLPGVVWARLDASWARQEKPSDTEFFVRAFLFGLVSYAITYLLYSVAGFDFTLFDFDKPAFTRTIVFEIASTTMVSLLLSVVWIYASTYKWLAWILHRIKATKRFGDEDVWDFTFNSRGKAVEFVHFRDFAQKVVYAGYVNTFSESGSVRELVLRDVVVYDFEGNEMYGVPLLYLSRKPEDMHIEFPLHAEPSE